MDNLTNITPHHYGGGQGGGLLLVLIGPTAVGKTELSLRLAKLLSCPIISADSRQIYKDMEIGTAAPTADELSQAKHYFIHTLPLDQYYSAAQYESDVLELMSSLRTVTPPIGRSWRGAILTGGSMMYIDAVCKGIDDIPTIDEETRHTLHQRLEAEGLETLAKELRLLDPEYYKTIDLENTKRVVHALEVCYMTGKPYSSFRQGIKKGRPFRIIKIGLTRSRENLFNRINQRVDKMMQLGLMEEARRLYPMRHLNSLNTVGYKELFKVLDGEWELPMAVERIKKNTRVYAKKQMTWFKHDPDIHWLDLDELTIEEAVEAIIQDLH